MPQTVEIPDHGIAEFPDSMTPDEIKGVIQKKFYASPTPQTGEVAPPTITESVPERPSAVAVEAVKAAPTSDIAANLGGAVTDIVKGLPQMALDTAKMGYEGLKFAALPQERPQILEKAVTQGLEQGRQLASDVQSPLGSRESFRGIAQLGMMAAPALGDILFPKPEGLVSPPVQKGTLTETLGFGEKTPDIVTETNDALSGLEKDLGKQEPVAPDLPTGTGEGSRQQTNIVIPESDISPLTKTGEVAFTPEGDYPVSTDSVAKAKADFPTKPDGWSQERYDIFIRQKAGAIEDQVRRDAEFNRQPSPVSEAPVSTTATPLTEVPTRKEFREHLNKTYPFNPKKSQSKGATGRLGATKRAYGDYLWSQDREMFENDYQNFLKERATQPPSVSVEGQAPTAPLSIQTTGEPNAIQSSNAQVETGKTTQRVQEGTGSEIPTTGSSDNALREAQGAAESGQIPARQGTEAQPQEVKPEIPEDATAKVQFKTSDGGQVTREMNAREAEGIFTKERDSYRKLIDCLGG